MKHIVCRVRGSPYSRSRKAGSQSWAQTVVEQTQHLPPVTGPCLLRITFQLPPDKYNDQSPYGPDIDNLVKKFVDTLKQTVLADAPGSDGCIIGLEAFKIPVSDEAEAGYVVAVYLIPVTWRSISRLPLQEAP